MEWDYSDPALCWKTCIDIKFVVIMKALVRIKYKLCQLSIYWLSLNFILCAYSLIVLGPLKRGLFRSWQTLSFLSRGHWRVTVGEKSVPASVHSMAGYPESSSSAEEAPPVPSSQRGSFSRGQPLAHRTPQHSRSAVCSSQCHLATSRSP